MKYRKKPVVIEAFLFGFDMEPDWFSDAIAKGVVRFVSNDKGNPEDIEIETLEGVHLARQTQDYIIKGVKGEIYPCKSDIFEMTYEKVDS